MAISSHVRSEDSKVGVLRERALKLGASIVNSHPVSPSKVEFVAEFKKAADKKAFDKWVKARKYECD